MKMLIKNLIKLEKHLKTKKPKNYLMLLNNLYFKKPKKLKKTLKISYHDFVNPINV